jgi:hypothetical protein
MVCGDALVAFPRNERGCTLFVGIILNEFNVPERPEAIALTRRREGLAGPAARVLETIVDVLRGLIDA